MQTALGVRIPLMLTIITMGMTYFFIFIVFYGDLYSFYSSFSFLVDNKETGFSNVLALENYSFEQPVVPGCLASCHICINSCAFFSLS